MVIKDLIYITAIAARVEVAGPNRRRKRFATLCGIFSASSFLVSSTHPAVKPHVVGRRCNHQNRNTDVYRQTAADGLIHRSIAANVSGHPDLVGTSYTSSSTVSVSRYAISHTI